jgi:hypothetical protein
MENGSKGVSLDEFIFRKLQPIRILRGYLANELELAEGDSIAMSRMDIDNIVSTIEIFLEEYDRVSGFRGRKGGHDHKKTSFMDVNKQQAIKTIA